MEHFAKQSSSVVVAKSWFIVCGVRQNLYVFSLYDNPDLDDRIFDCFLTSTFSNINDCPCRLRMRVPLSCLCVI